MMVDKPTYFPGVRVYAIVLGVIFVTMFSRVLTGIGLPSLINFLHFSVVLGAVFLVLHKVQYKEAVYLLYGMLFLLVSMIVSAIINEVGFINVFLSFVLLSEPFLLLIIMFAARWQLKSIHFFRFWFLLISVVHVLLAYFQRWVLGLTDDGVVGLFIGVGAGPHLAGAVALSAAVYIYFTNSISFPKWARLAVSIMIATVAVLSDAKQVLAVFLVSMLILMVTSLGDWRKLLMLSALSALSGLLIIILAVTVFPGLLVWVNVDLLYEGITQKFSVFPIIVSYYDSALNWWFGLGPGHTVGRLGAMLPDYISQLYWLGATTSETTSTVWEHHQGHYMSNSITGSSMFSLFFSWAGVWGDLGIVGLVAYVTLWIIVWSVVSNDILSRFLVITILVFGGVFGWMEEPQYMLYTVAILGLRWQELGAPGKRYVKKNSQDTKMTIV